MCDRGFSLIEIMVALAVFAILAVITSSVLVNAVQLDHRITTHQEHFHDIELAMALLSQDTTQFIPRAVRGNEMHLFPPIVGQATYVEFTRAGVVNPDDLAQQSN